MILAVSFVLALELDSAFELEFALKFETRFDSDFGKRELSGVLERGLCVSLAA